MERYYVQNIFVARHGNSDLWSQHSKSWRIWFEPKLDLCNRPAICCRILDHTVNPKIELCCFSISHCIIFPILHYIVFLITSSNIFSKVSTSESASKISIDFRLRKLSTNPSFLPACFPSFFSRFICFIQCSARMYAHTPEEVTKSHSRWLWVTMCLLGIELKTWKSSQCS